MEQTQKITIDLWSPFTVTELDGKAQEMSAASLHYDEVDTERKVSAGDYNKTLKQVRAEMVILSKQIRARGMERPIECLVKFHVPRIAMKTIVRLDTGELVREEAMTPEECQMNLFVGRDIEELNKIYGDREEEGPLDGKSESAQ